MELGMFTRQNVSYNYTPELLLKIEKDPVNPLNIITGLIDDGRKVLDIGAGNGLLAELFKNKGKNVVIDGIEPNVYAADIAKHKYRNFYIGYAQDYLSQLKDQGYDFIVMADILEHMENPLQFLNDLHELVEEKTQMILSTPNIAFGAVRLSLMKGDFNYVDSGIIEKTHLRFFTLQTLKEITEQSRFHVSNFIYLRRNFLKSEIKFKMRISDFPSFYKIYKDDLSSVYQFLLVFSKSIDNVTIVKAGKGISHPFISFFNYLIKAKKRKYGVEN
jgi:2-polyprenyl-3-methyl-5-hydroxy-6-metoxy-1,4-benzoquinol methylase